MSHVKLVTCAPVERSAVSCCCVSKPPRTHNWQSRLSRLNFSKAATPAVDHAKKIMFPLLRRDDLAVCDYSQGTVHFTRVRLSAILATRSNVPSWPTPVACRSRPRKLVSNSIVSCQSLLSCVELYCSLTAVRGGLVRSDRISEFLSGIAEAIKLPILSLAAWRSMLHPVSDRPDWNEAGSGYTSSGNCRLSGGRG
jgi:hypothetical protein